MGFWIAVAVFFPAFTFFFVENFSSNMRNFSQEIQYPDLHQVGIRLSENQVFTTGSI